MLRICVINLSTGKVDNIVELGRDVPANCVEDTAPPTGFLFIGSDTAQIGWSYASGQFIAPPSPPTLPPAPVPPTPRQWLERLAPATQAAITKAAVADTSGMLLLWLFRGCGNPTIDVTAQETKDGVAALVSAGVITAQDQATLLAP